MLARFLHSKHILVEKLNKYICKSTVSSACEDVARTHTHQGNVEIVPSFTIRYRVRELARSDDDDDLPQASKNEQYEHLAGTARRKSQNF